MKFSFRKIHRYLGIGVSGFLLLIVGTGIALQHPEWFKTQALSSPITHYLSFNNTIYIGSDDGLFQKLNSGDYERVSIPFQQSKVVSMFELNEELIVGFEEGLILKLNNSIWDSIPAPKHTYTLFQISAPQGQLQATTENGIFTLSHSGWSQIEVQPFQNNTLDFIERLHTGYIFNDTVRKIYHLFSWLILIMTLSGIIIFFWKRR